MLHSVTSDLGLHCLHRSLCLSTSEYYVTVPNMYLLEVLFVLRFYGPVNPMGSCRARSVYLTTRLLGRLSPLSG